MKPRLEFASLYGHLTRIAEIFAEDTSSLLAKKLDKKRYSADTCSMAMSIANRIRTQIEAKGDSLWRLSDFEQFPASATAQAFSRLSREGLLQRVAKGVYYHPGDSSFGKTKLNPQRLRKLGLEADRLFPAGLSAAAFLGFSTQTPRSPEYSTPATSVQRRLLSPNAIVHIRRPRAWNTLTDEEAALLELIRNQGAHSELSLEAGIERLLELLSTKHRFENLCKVLETEPARVTAILGAAAQQLGKGSARRRALRERLNPLSRFEFGRFAGLQNAHQWQAKDSSRNETLSTS